MGYDSAHTIDCAVNWTYLPPTIRLFVRLCEYSKASEEKWYSFQP